MWRPRDVVTEHKTRATALWVALLLLLVGFIVWQTTALVEKYENPSTSFGVSDDAYRFPYTEVCMGNRYGCDWSVPGCLESVNATVLDPCGDIWDVQIESAPTSDACVTFDMEQVETEAFGVVCPGVTERPYVEVQMNWISDNETSLQYSSSVPIYLGGAHVQDVSAVPYTRLVSPDDQLTPEVSMSRTDLTIGKNVRSFLSGDDIITYPVLTSSTTYEITRDPSDWYYRMSDNVLGSSANSSYSIGDNPAYGHLHFVLILGSFSLTELSEENPIDMFDYIGNIGGFWEILLLVWGLFFIAKHTDRTPREKARRFAKAIQKRLPMANHPAADTTGARCLTVASPEDVGLDEYPNLNSIDGRVSVEESTV